MQAIFLDINRPASNEFSNNVQRDYGAEIFGINFQQPVEASQQINNLIRDATRGLIPYSILPQELKDAEMVLMTALYFKGQWKVSLIFCF